MVEYARPHTLVIIFKKNLHLFPWLNLVTLTLKFLSPALALFLKSGLIFSYLPNILSQMTKGISDFTCPKLSLGLLLSPNLQCLTHPLGVSSYSVVMLWSPYLDLLIAYVSIYRSGSELGHLSFVVWHTQQKYVEILRVHGRHQLHASFSPDYLSDFIFYLLSITSLQPSCLLAVPQTFWESSPEGICLKYSP